MFYPRHACPQVLEVSTAKPKKPKREPLELPPYAAGLVPTPAELAELDRRHDEARRAYAGAAAVADGGAVAPLAEREAIARHVGHVLAAWGVDRARADEAFYANLVGHPRDDGACKRAFEMPAAMERAARALGSSTDDLREAYRRALAAVGGASFDSALDLYKDKAVPAAAMCLQADVALRHVAGPDWRRFAMASWAPPSTEAPGGTEGSQAGGDASATPAAAAAPDAPAGDNGDMDGEGMGCLGGRGRAGRGRSTTPTEQ